jgi:hypothetical protein
MTFEHAILIIFGLVAVGGALGFWYLQRETSVRDDGETPTRDLLKWSRANWNRLPDAQRKLCLDHLDGWISRKQFEALRQNRCNPQFHLLGGGMLVRNRLREVLLDEDLPGVPYANGALARNWDDYYQGALDELLERQ